MAAAEQLITANLDIWSSAIKTKSAAGRGKSNKLELYGIKKLRELILELAVRGLLVPQDPSDEPGSELLKKIAAAKAQLVKDKKIKKPKALLAIGDDEKPFDIPESWSWMRLPEIYYAISPGKKKLKSSEIQESGKYPVVDQGQEHISGFSDDKSLVIEIPGPLVVFGDHTRNIKYIDFDFVPGADGTKILCPFLIFPRYFYTYLSHYDLEGRGYARHFKVLNDNLIALPPLSEQTRIVAKVDELMALCDQLEQQQETSITAHQTLVQTLLDALTTASERDGFTAAWARIADHFDTLFTTEWSIDQLKQTILQLAVMGKLVPQDPSDEPAGELLKKIVAEKAKLVKDGKIRKQKALPPIEADEIPFELPQGWELVRFGNLMNLVSGQHLKPDEYSEIFEEGMIPYLTGPAEFGERYPEASRYTSERRSVADKGDLLITCKGSGVGKLNEANQEIFISRQLMAIQPIVIGSNFSMLIAESLNERLRENVVGIAIPGISREDVTDAVIWLPPELEQHRIVAKVDELMALCDILKTRLNTVQTTQLQLADAMAEQAIG